MTIRELSRLLACNPRPSS